MSISDTKFTKLCDKYSIWVIQYNSYSIDSPIFMVWYTDKVDNDKDKLLFNTSGKIISSTTLSGLYKKLTRKKQKSLHPKGFRKWIKKWDTVKIHPFEIYDINLIAHGIKYKDLDVYSLEALGSFINLFGDLADQMDSSILWGLFKKKPIKGSWMFFYDWIFWPRFSNNEKFERLNIPFSELDYKGLAKYFPKMVEAFEKQVKRHEP